MILMVIIFAAIISVVLVKTALSSITQVETLNVSLQKTESKLLNNACTQEALIQLNRDETYIGGALTFGEGTCNITISESEGNYTLEITSNINNLYATTTVVSTLDPFTIVSWDN